MIANEIFAMSFWHLKVTQPLPCFLVNHVFVSSSPWISILSPISVSASLVEKLLPCLSPEFLWNLYIFPTHLSSFHRGTETGCFDTINNDLMVHLINKCVWFYTKPLKLIKSCLNESFTKKKSEYKIASSRTWRVCTETTFIQCLY